MQTAFHQERVAAVADRYRKHGYRVVEEPEVGQLPDFLQEFKPDLLAENGAESVIVEVQAYGQVVRNPKLERLAESVERHPGWRFELIISNPSAASVSELPTADSKQSTIGVAEIEDRIGSSQHLATAGDSQAAVILLWSALEAAIRTGLERIPASFINNAPVAILKQGIAYGLMDPEDYEVLSQLLPVRNAAAHGFAGVVNANLLDASTRITNSILAEVKEMK